MFNSTFKNPGKPMKRSAPMKQTGFKRPADAKPMRRSAALVAKPADSTPAKPRSTLKTRRAPTSKIRQSAATETCRLRLPGVCKVEPGNVVWAHSNRGEHGKGGGLKADDEWGAYACFWCHCVYDRQHRRPPGMTLEFVETEFTRAMGESRARLVQKGLLPNPSIAMVARAEKECHA